MLPIEPVVLENAWVRLEPSRLDHAEVLSEGATPDTFRYFTTAPADTTPAGLREYIQSVLDAPDTISYTVIDPGSGRAVGMTSFMDIRLAHKGLEIGRTWYAESMRGTKINPASKLLLIGHAIENLGFERVQLKTDGRNLHSQAAIKKLGGHYEGTLRKHMVMPDGFLRNTVMFSILPNEWPAVKAGLLKRLT